MNLGLKVTVVATQRNCDKYLCSISLLRKETQNEKSGARASGGVGVISENAGG